MKIPTTLDRKMKKLRLFTFALAVWLLIAALPSCGLMETVPKAPAVFDKDFKESFAKDYRRTEPNLMYVSAIITDAEIYIEAEQSCEESGGRYNLGAIKNVQNHQFVAAVKRKPIIGRGWEYSLSVYSHGRLAPVIESWTVKSINVLALPEKEFSIVRFYGENEDQKAQSFAADPLQYHMDHGAVELAVFEGAEHQEQLKSLGNSYQTRKAYESTAVPAQPLSVYLDDAGSASMKCVVLVRFEETDNLIWVARLYSDNKRNKLYMDCSEYTDYEVVRLVEIESTLAELILAQIDSQDLNQ